MFIYRYSFYKSFIVTSPSARSTGNSTPTTTIFTSAANSSESKPALLRTTSGSTKFTANPDFIEEQCLLLKAQLINYKLINFEAKSSNF